MENEIEIFKSELKKIGIGEPAIHYDFSTQGKFSFPWCYWRLSNEQKMSIKKIINLSCSHAWTTREGVKTFRVKLVKP